MKRTLKILVFVLILALTGSISSVFGIADSEPPKEETPEIGAEYAVIFNADDGEILYGKNETSQVYCGFLPRVMTCLLIAESGKWDETVTVNQGMLVNTPQISTVQLKAGDTISYRDLVTCILVTNSQEAAVAAATSLGGDLKTFVAKMNEKARQLGAKDTVFTNVTGDFVYNTKQYSTLQDCAKLLSAALQIEEIAETAALRTAQITVNGKNRTLYTRNMLIETMNANYNSAAKGLFIYSQSDSNSSIATCRKDSDQNVISMAVTTKGLESLYKDAGVLLKYSKNRYMTRTLVSRGSSLAEVKVNNGKDVDYVLLSATENVTAMIPKIYGTEEPTLTFELPESVDAPLEKGTVIGKATVSCGGKVYGTVELKTESSVELDYFALYSAKMMKFFSNPWLWLVLGGLLVIVAGYILLVYRINHPKKKKAPASRTGGRIRVSPAKDDD